MEPSVRARQPARRQQLSHSLEVTNEVQGCGALTSECQPLNLLNNPKNMAAEVMTWTLLALEHKCSLAFRAPAAMNLNFKRRACRMIGGVKVIKPLRFVMIITLIAED